MYKAVPVYLKTVPVYLGKHFSGNLSQLSANL